MSAPGVSGGESRSGTAGSVVPSFAEACRLLHAPYSCLVVRSSRRHVALAPLYLRRKRTGIQEKLSAELLRFSESMKGVPLAYDDVKILGEHGDILDDQGFIHMTVEATFVIFRPKKGQKLQGVINKIGVTHVGCLVHGCFNASIPKPHQFTVGAWKDVGLKLGDNLEFEVSQLDADAAGVLLIRGRLDRNRVQELLERSQAAKNTPVEEQLEEQAPLDTTDSAKKTKKKDKRQDEEALRVDVVTEESAKVQMNVQEAEDAEHNGLQNSKKKKKKNKRQDEEAVLVDVPLKEDRDEVEVNIQEPDAAEHNGLQNSKKKKKNKRQDEEAVLVDVPLKEESAEVEVTVQEPDSAEHNGLQNRKKKKSKRQDEEALRVDVPLKEESAEVEVNVQDAADAEHNSLQNSKKKKHKKVKEEKEPEQVIPSSTCDDHGDKVGRKRKRETEGAANGGEASCGTLKIRKKKIKVEES